MFALFDHYMPGLDYSKMSMRQLTMKLQHLVYIRTEEAKLHAIGRALGL
jgi:hypothetical protein